MAGEQLFQDSEGAWICKKHKVERGSNRYGSNCYRCKVERNNQLQAELQTAKEELDKHRWIPVSERLPEIVIDDGDGMEFSADVLITDGLSIIIASFSKYHDEWHSIAFGAELSVAKEDITHWKPIVLPEEGPERK